MEDFTAFLIFIAIGIIFLVWLEWIIGKAIGRNVSRLTGILLGIALIIFGFSFLIGIACIIYSQQNANDPININSNINANINHQYQSDTIECPYCAETIKKNAKICRYCNNKL